MKIIISGATGHIGSGILARCLEHPSVTSILVLTRRDIPDLASNPKAEVIIVNDFTAYEPAVIDKLRTADAALWCLGTSHGNERVDIAFPLAFIEIIKTRAAGSKPFRYIQLSGALTEPPPPKGEQPRSLWFFANGRRVRGAMEAEVIKTTEGDPSGSFTVYLVKPGGVLRDNWAFVQKWILGDNMGIVLGELSAAMVDLAVQGNDQKLFSNRELIKHGRAVLEMAEGTGSSGQIPRYVRMNLDYALA